MRKVLIIVTSIILCLSICSCGFYAYRFYSYNKIDSISNDIDVIDKKINKINKEIDEKKDEIESVKRENFEKSELLELWKKALNQVKKDS